MKAIRSRRSFIRYSLAGAGSALLPACTGRDFSRRQKHNGLRIVFYSDVHARSEWDTPVAVARAAKAINGLEPDLVIGGGDLITDGFQSAPGSMAERWNVYAGMRRAIRAQHHTAIGNHDLVGAMPEDGSAPAADPRAEFRGQLGVERTYYSFDASGYHFMLLDSMRITDFETKYEGYVGEEQLDWIRADLATIRAGMPIVVVLHIPLLTAFYQATEGATAPAPSDRVVVNSTQVLDAFAGHNLMLVLQGHLHVAEMLRWRQTTFITGGAICGKWWRGPWQGTHEGFCSITLRDEQVDWEYVNYGWEARRPRNA